MRNPLFLLVAALGSGLASASNGSDEALKKLRAEKEKTATDKGKEIRVSAAKSDKLKDKTAFLDSLQEFATAKNAFEAVPAIDALDEDFQRLVASKEAVSVDALNKAFDAFTKDSARLNLNAEYAISKITAGRKSAEILLREARSSKEMKEAIEADPALKKIIEDAEFFAIDAVADLDAAYHNLRQRARAISRNTERIVTHHRRAVETAEDALANAKHDAKGKAEAKKKVAAAQKALDEITKLLLKFEKIAKEQKSEYRAAVEKRSVSKQISVVPKKSRIPIIIVASSGGLLVVAAFIYFFVMRKH